MDARIIWLEIPVADLDRATSFYADVFQRDLKVTVEGPRRFAEVLPLQEGRAGCSIMQVDGFKPSEDGVLTYFHIADIDSMLERVTNCGGSVIIPKKEMAPGLFFATFRDSEGNTLGISADQ